MKKVSIIREKDESMKETGFCGKESNTGIVQSIIKCIKFSCCHNTSNEFLGALFNVFAQLRM